jgi:hypothetical protein
MLFFLPNCVGEMYGFAMKLPRCTLQFGSTEENNLGMPAASLPALARGELS